MTVSFPGHTDQTSFETEAEALAFAKDASQAGDKGTVTVIDPQGHPKGVPSGGSAAAAAAS